MNIPFEIEYRKKYYQLLDEIFNSNFLSEGKMVKRFEEEFCKFTGIPSLAVTNGGTALLSIFEYKFGFNKPTRTKIGESRKIRRNIFSII